MQESTKSTDRTKSKSRTYRPYRLLSELVAVEQSCIARHSGVRTYVRRAGVKRSERVDGRRSQRRTIWILSRNCQKWVTTDGGVLVRTLRLSIEPLYISSLALSLSLFCLSVRVYIVSSSRNVPISYIYARASLSRQVLLACLLRTGRFLRSARNLASASPSSLSSVAARDARSMRDRYRIVVVVVVVAIAIAAGKMR